MPPWLYVLAGFLGVGVLAALAGAGGIGVLLTALILVFYFLPAFIASKRHASEVRDVVVEQIKRLGMRDAAVL